MIISGQDAVLQLGLADTWGTPRKTTMRIPMTSERFDMVPTLKAAEALVGAKTNVGFSVMSKKAMGGFDSYVTPDNIRMYMLGALGLEKAAVSDGSQYKHEYNLIPSGTCRQLPQFTAEINRNVDKGLFSSFKMNSWKLSGAQEDFITFSCDGPGHSEVVQKVLAKGDVLATSTIASLKTTIGLITNGLYAGAVGAMFKPDDKCNTIIYFTCAAFAAGVSVITAVPGQDAARISAFPVGVVTDYDFEIYNWDMTPQLSLSELPYLTFLNGRAYLEATDGLYNAASTGQIGDFIYDIPTAAIGDAANPITVEAEDQYGEVRVFKYVGTPLTGRATTKLTMVAYNAGSLTPDEIQAIYSPTWAIDVTKWVEQEDVYEEITSFTLSGENNVTDGKFGMNGSPYQTELEPQARGISLQTSMRYNERVSQMRQRRMMDGKPLFIRLEFITSIEEMDGTVETYRDSTGEPFKMVVDLPKCYFNDGGGRNVSGPDEITISPTFTAAETLGASPQEAIKVTIWDPSNLTIPVAGARTDRVN